MLLDGYIRVSQVAGRRGDQFISPSMQRGEIEAWTKSHRASLGEIFEELDESGARADRPLLLEAIERVESGESNGVIVAKLDRFGRSVVDGLRSIARIEGAGGTFISVQDGFDLSTPTGRLVMRILFSVGEWEYERVRNNWGVAQARAIARGVYIGSRGPIGYRHGPDRRLVIEPGAAAGVIREAFERRRRGETFEKIAAFLNDSNLETESGVPFSVGHAQDMIRNSAYRGEAHIGDHKNPAAHEAIVDPGLWQECQSQPKEPRSRTQGLLSGRIRCAACGRLMSVQKFEDRNRLAFYACVGAHARCSEPARMGTELLDPLIEEFVLNLCRRDQPSGSAATVAKCEEALVEAEEDLIAYRDNPRLLRTLGSESFEAGKAERERLCERRLLELARARRAVEKPGLNAADLERRWPSLSWEERGAVVTELIDCVVVKRGREPVIERAWVFRRGCGLLAIDLCRTIGSFNPELRRARRLRQPRRWPKRRIEAELRAFFAGREEWPKYPDFAEEGLGRLHAQILLWGGPHYWGHKLGVKVPRGIVRWNDTLLGDALAPLLRGRNTWPTREEFEEEGLGVAREAVLSGRGVAHWAKEFGIEDGLYRRWSEQRIERELIEFVGERDTFPLRREFQESGVNGLLHAAERHGGLSYWAERIGVRRSGRGVARKGR